MDAVILAIRQINVLLLRVLREREIPGGAGAQSFLVHESFLDESSIRLEHLDAVIDAVANVKLVVIREIRAMNRVAELLGRRRLGIVTANICIVGLVPVSAP